MRIDEKVGKNKSYWSTDESCVFTSGKKDDNFIHSCNRTFLNGYDCSGDMEVTLDKKEVLNIVNLAKCKGWI